MGSLTADLLTLHNDSYVVRAQVQVEGILLATGMAAAPSIEAAEDQARFRALQALGLEPAANANSTPPMNIGDSIIPKKTMTMAHGPIEPPILAEPNLDIPPSIKDSVGQSNDSVEQSSFQLKFEPQTATVPPELAKPKISQSTPPNISQSPVDLSDIIAQTDVELRRLRWTSAQGREYLEQTYGKRSRQQLSDEELLAFLLYLESQPSPIEPQK